jgi:hypothetical protein
LAFRWAADLLHFPGLWSRFVCPFCSQGKSQVCEQYHFHQAFVPLIDYMDADVYGLGLQFTTINRSSQILTGVFLLFSGLLTVYSTIVIVDRGK